MKLDIASFVKLRIFDYIGIAMENFSWLIFDLDLMTLVFLRSPLLSITPRQSFCHFSSYSYMHVFDGCINEFLRFQLFFKKQCNNILIHMKWCMLDSACFGKIAQLHLYGGMINFCNFS